MVKPIETLAEAQRRAKRRLPKDIYNLLVGGTEKGLTARANVEAFDEIGFHPHPAQPLPIQRDLTTRVLGLDMAFPVIVSPAGAQVIDPAGEVAVAKASAAAGIPMGLSSFASMPFEDVIAQNPNSLFQLYWVGTREQITQRVERVRRAGAKTLILTIDWAFPSRRDWGSPDIPPVLDLPTLIKYSPMGITRPGWALRWLKGGLPDLKVPNLGVTTEATPTFRGAYLEWMNTPLPTWEDVKWLGELWDGPFIVKGITNPEDARRAVDAGADAISVSNHGGNNLDGTPASLRFLPKIVDAVGDQVEVLFDGGIRRGADVVKALALGARAVLVGRVWLFGLAAGGEEGVRQVLEILRSGIDGALIGLGHPSVKDLSRTDLIIPEGFAL